MRARGIRGSPETKGSPSCFFSNLNLHLQLNYAPVTDTTKLGHNKADQGGQLARVAL